MPITVIEDLISPDIGGRSDENGLVQPRRFIVSGLTPGSGIFFQARAAIAASPYNCYYLAPHPDDSGIQCRIIEPEPFLNSATTVKVLATYQTPQFFGISEQIVRFRASTEGVLSNWDNTGKAVKVSYTPPGGIRITKPGQISEQYSVGVLEFEFSGYAPPSAEFLSAFNCLNSSRWQGGDKDTWWFEDLVSEENVYQGTFRSQMRFSYNPFGWTSIVAYRDVNGNVPTDVDDVTVTGTSGNGWVRATTKGHYNFNSLNLRNVL